MPEQMTDAQVLSSLLAEETVDGYTVKPWTIKQLLQVMPILEALATELKGKGVTLENLGEVFEAQGIVALKDILQALLPHLPEFLAISLRIGREETEEFDLGMAARLGSRVLALNLEHLKNSFSLIMAQVEGMIRQ